MASVHRKPYTKALPVGAEVFIRKGERLVRWQDARGKKRTAKVTTGKDGSERIILRSNTFTAKYRDGSGVVREVATGCRDETAARAVLADLVRRAELVKSKVLTADESAAADHQNVSLSVHFEAYAGRLKAENATASWITTTRNRLKRITGECGFRRLCDLNGAALERWLVDRQAEGVSASARNGYRKACVAFGNWCVRTKRLTANPFADVPVADEKADPQRQRRALTEDELGRLLSVARHRPLLDAMTIRRGPRKGEMAAKVKPATRRRLEALGRERALIYKTLVLTGLRKGELASLTVGQLELDGPTAYVVLHAADEKNRQGSEVPLRADLANDLRRWVADKLKAAQMDAERLGEPIPERLPHDTPLFKVPDGLVRILDRDLKAAGIPKRDERGRTVDVHALRHSFGSLLSKVGTAPRTAQAAMRHASIDLTMNVYTDPKVLDVAAALDKLPDLPLDDDEGQAEQLRATGTDDAAARTLAPVLAPDSDNSCISGTTTDKSTAVENRSGESVSVDADKAKEVLSAVDKNGRYWARTSDLLLVRQAL